MSDIRGAFLDAHEKFLTSHSHHGTVSEIYQTVSGEIIMLYVSIILFIAGIALIVYSFLSRSSSSAKIVPMEGVVQPDANRGAASAATRKSGEQQVAPQEDRNKTPDESPETPRATEKPSAPQSPERKTESSPGKQAPAPPAPAKEEKDMAVLYHDASGIVDYEGGTSIIDPSFKKYSKLKRIGSGHVSVVGDGINFQMRKKLYRFEFYLLDKMVQGENYLALFLKGSTEPRLFIFKRGSGIEKKLAREYAAYRKKQI